MTNRTLGDGPALFRWQDPRHAAPRTGDLCALGAPTDHGNVVSRGAAHGPAAIRRASVQRAALPSEGWDIGDVDRSDSPDWQPYLHRIGDATRMVRRLGLVPLLLGGDHSVTYAPVSVILEEHDLCLIWLDAHTDFSPWSGQDHHNHKQVLRRISTLPGIRNIVQIGYRGITLGDERSLGKGSQVVTSAHVRRLSARELLAFVPSDLPCYVSIDIDVVDPACAPGTSAPVPGGLLPAQIAAFLALLARHRKIAGIDLTELNPLLDPGGGSAAVAAGLIAGLVDHWDGQRVREIVPDPGTNTRLDRAAQSGTPLPSACAAGTE